MSLRKLRSVFALALLIFGISVAPTRCEAQGEPYNLAIEQLNDGTPVTCRPSASVGSLPEYLTPNAEFKIAITTSCNSSDAADVWEPDDKIEQAQPVFTDPEHGITAKSVNRVAAFIRGSVGKRVTKTFWVRIGDKAVPGVYTLNVNFKTSRESTLRPISIYVSGNDISSYLVVAVEPNPLAVSYEGSTPIKVTLTNQLPLSVPLKLTSAKLTIDSKGITVKNVDADISHEKPLIIRPNEPGEMTFSTTYSGMNALSQLAAGSEGSAKAKLTLQYGLSYNGREYTTDKQVVIPKIDQCKLLIPEIWLFAACLAAAFLAVTVGHGVRAILVKFSVFKSGVNWPVAATSSVVLSAVFYAVNFKVSVLSNFTASLHNPLHHALLFLCLGILPAETLSGFLQNIADIVKKVGEVFGKKTDDPKPAGDGGAAGDEAQTPPPQN